MRAATIAAVSSPPGPGPRGVIRVSGPRAAHLLSSAVRLERPLTARGLYRGRFLDGRGEQPLLLLWMPAPHSYTREDVAELHLPGSPWLVDAALRRLYELGAEPAAPGEFTRRAFESGRIDLLQAEGVLELVASASEVERRAGLALLGGGLGRRIERLREALVELRALCEASLDFDEADTGHVPLEALLALGARARAQLDEALSWEERREPLADLPRVVLVGAPNAGKSTLFNRLCPGSAALVSDLAGTTRDFLVGLWPLGPRGARLVDTAGLDAALAAGAGPDRQAQQRAREQQASADLLLCLGDPAEAEPVALEEAFAALPPRPPRCLVWTKSDLGGVPQALPAPLASWPAVRVSARAGSGLDALEELAGRLLGWSVSELAAGGEPNAGRALSLRHRRALAIARDELTAGLQGLEAGSPLDLVAESLRHATEALDGILGRTTPEDVLDRIFARFCLGK